MLPGRLVAEVPLTAPPLTAATALMALDFADTLLLSGKYNYRQLL